MQKKATLRFRRRTCFCIFISILVVFLWSQLTRAQAKAIADQVPREPEKLALWLRQDGERSRIWQALDAILNEPVSSPVKGVLVEQLLTRVSPREFEGKLGEVPALAAGTMSLIGDSLSSSHPPLTSRLQAYVARSAFSRSQRLGRRGAPYNREECEALLSLQFIDPERFVSDSHFRQRVLAILPESFDPDAPAELRDLLLWSINQVPGIDFESSESIERGWGAAVRGSLERQVRYHAQDSFFPDDIGSSINASIYSLPSQFVDRVAALDFLETLRDIAPQRELVVLVDLPLREELEPRARELKIHLLETHGRGYTPWPRDPFSLLQRRDGGVLLLTRPGGQVLRSEDDFMSLELIQGLPEPLDKAWRKVQWARSSVFFHNGQVLLSPNQTWISLHTLEPRILQLLGIDRVPVEDFATRSGWLPYLEATRKAASELGALYQREVTFVHRLPENEDEAELGDLIRRIGGGAGFDLDSLLTLGEGPGASLQALVGDVDSGRDLLELVSTTELEAFRKDFQIQPEAGRLEQKLLDAQKTLRARALDDYLELISESLKAEGVVVHRLPLFLVPVEILSNRAEFKHIDFLVTWNNVVLESREGIRRAEGFSSLLQSGDDRSRKVFEDAGYQLNLIPPLVRSVILNGGYRCASQHLRSFQRMQAHER